MLSSNTNRASLSLESLDQRALPSVTATLQGPVLVLTSDSAGDTVVVEGVAGDQIKVTVNGQSIGQAPRAMFQGVIFQGNGGDDIFVNASSLLAVADGGDGNDILASFSASQNFFAGGNGNDILIGGGGDDFLVGGAGNDTLFGGAGRDIVAGNEGRDHEFGGHDANDVFDDRGTDPDDDLNDDNGVDQNDQFDDNGNDGDEAGDDRGDDRGGRRGPG